MFIKNKLHFVSIEGNWDKNIHDERIAYAANILKKDESSFAIASGTCAPASYSSFFQGRLGKYTRETLMNQYGIQAMRILPAYLFPYNSTYTIIDAFANAALIGWGSCGLKKREDGIKVLFELGTSAFHGQRVEILNHRACKYLQEFGVHVELKCKNKLPWEEMERGHQEEVTRLQEMQGREGLITTGEWLDHGKRRSYDDINRMKEDLEEAFKEAGWSLNSIDIGSFSDLERLLFTLLWNELAGKKRLGEKEFDGICSYLTSHFGMNIPKEALMSMKRSIK